MKNLFNMAMMIGLLAPMTAIGQVNKPAEKKSLSKKVQVAAGLATFGAGFAYAIQFDKKQQLLHNKVGGHLTDKQLRHVAAKATPGKYVSAWYYPKEQKGGFASMIFIEESNPQKVYRSLRKLQDKGARITVINGIKKNEKLISRLGNVFMVASVIAPIYAIANYYSDDENNDMAARFNSGRGQGKTPERGIAVSKSASNSASNQ